MAALKATVVNVKLFGPHVPRVVGTYCISSRGAHDVVKDQRDNLTAYKRGKGGRGSFSGIVATVFGASGFLGRYVVNRLAKIGSQVVCPYRGDPYFVKDLKLGGELGQVLFLPFDLRDEDSIRKCMKYSNVIINLIGRDWETKNFKFNDVHIDGARRLARIARESGIERFIHMSHLNARPDPPAIYVKGGSQYLKSKYYSELAVREEFPDATIFRPADIYGLEDRFIRYYASAWRRAHGRMPLWKKGEKTVKSPVFCFDVAQGILNSLQEPRAIGNNYDCVGPNSYLLSDLVDYFYRCMRWSGFRRTYVTPIFKLKVMYMSYAPSTPILTLDKLDREHVSDVLHEYDTLEDLGVKLTPIEDRAQYELKPFRLHRYYEERVGEFADPEPPPVLS